jgi:8-oxo-dGTP pyrophosphatase MutT (NUDIX family)
MEPLTHAGGIVYRHGANGPEFLLARARRDPGVWVIPKGHIETGESPEETAVREIAEETGVRAVVEAPIGRDEFETPRGPVRALFFLMRYEGDVRALEDRETVWLPEPDAGARLGFPGAQRIVRRASEMLQERGAR